MRTAELERRLIEWGDEYGGGRYDNVGWPSSSSVSTLMLYHGRAPQGLNPRAIIGTAADQIEDIVRAMAKARGGNVRASILRCEYWMRSAALEHKLQRLLVKDHIRVTVHDYHRQLHAARTLVAEALSLRGEMPQPPEAVTP